MNFLVNINIMPLKALLDPQGKAVQSSLNSIGFEQINQVRVGKRIQLEVSCANEAEAGNIAKEACEKLLCNKVMEYYEIEVTVC
jgi:phosphoribosylformylglycinamidine synthase